MKKTPFKLGDVYATAGIQIRMKDEQFSRFVNDSLKRFRACDWGNMCKEDKALNDRAVKQGDGRIHGAYIRPDSKERIWIITESDRSVTTVLFPDEY